MINIFGRLRLGGKKSKTKPVGNAAVSSDSDEKVFRLWSWSLPLLFGLTAGWFGMACFEVWLEGLNGRYRPVAMASSLVASDKEADSDNLAAFLRVNPFKVTPMPNPDDDFVEADDDLPHPQVLGALDTAVLKGTSPGILAWMENQGALKLVMVGSSFDAYTLADVTYMDATFVRDDDQVVKEISYSRDGATVASLPPPQSLPVIRSAAPEYDQVVPSDPSTGMTGSINRDMVNSLLENPFEELRKVRIRPAEEGEGLKVEWIAHDSILSKLGVQRNDVVLAVNGIAFRNAMDISNSLSSMMDSDQFNVDVVRNGAPTSLQYVVR